MPELACVVDGSWAVSEKLQYSTGLYFENGVDTILRIAQ